MTRAIGRSATELAGGARVRGAALRPTAIVVMSVAGLVGCSGAAERDSAVDWGADRSVRAASGPGCADMPGSPREWIAASTPANPAVGARLRIADPCAGVVSGAAIRIASTGAFAKGSTFLVTQNWNPRGVGGTYNAHPIGVHYDGTDYWIVNEDGAAMPQGAAFNVALDALATIATPPGQTSKALVIPGATSPGATFLATHFIDPPGANPAIFTAEPLLRFVNGNWQIESTSGFFGADVAFNVSARGATSFLVNDAIFDFAYIDPPITDPNAYVFVTQNATPAATPGKSATATIKVPIGVWYDAGAGKWAVFNEDRSAMPVGAGFGVWNPT